MSEQKKELKSFMNPAVKADDSVAVQQARLERLKTEDEEFDNANKGGLKTVIVNTLIVGLLLAALYMLYLFIPDVLPQFTAFTEKIAPYVPLVLGGVMLFFLFLFLFIEILNSGFAKKGYIERRNEYRRICIQLVNRPVSQKQTSSAEVNALIKQKAETIARRAAEALAKQRVEKLVNDGVLVYAEDNKKKPASQPVNGNIAYPDFTPNADNPAADSGSSRFGANTQTPQTAPADDDQTTQVFKRVRTDQPLRQPVYGYEYFNNRGGNQSTSQK